MLELTPEGRRIVDDLARRHAVSSDAVRSLLHALVAGHGTQAQFNHPDLGGIGQWSQGGMIMIGDMFNQALKSRVASLCSELATLVRNQPTFNPVAASQSQSQSQGPMDSYSGVSLFVRREEASSGKWWPLELGSPASVGAQNELRYAYFPVSHRLAIQQGSRVTVYDIGDHRITGFSQQQSGDQSLTFTSQHGLVRVADLPVVARSHQNTATVAALYTRVATNTIRAVMSPAGSALAAEAQNGRAARIKRFESCRSDLEARAPLFRDEGASGLQPFFAAALRPERPRPRPVLPSSAPIPERGIKLDAASASTREACCTASAVVTAAFDAMSTPASSASLTTCCRLRMAAAAASSTSAIISRPRGEPVSVLTAPNQLSNAPAAVWSVPLRPCAWWWNLFLACSVLLGPSEPVLLRRLVPSFSSQLSPLQVLLVRHASSLHHNPGAHSAADGLLQIACRASGGRHPHAGASADSGDKLDASLRRIAKVLSERGIRTPRRAAWQALLAVLVAGVRPREVAKHFGLSLAEIRKVLAEVAD